MLNICIGQQLTLVEVSEQPLTVVVPPLCIRIQRSGLKYTVEHGVHASQKQIVNACGMPSLE